MWLIGSEFVELDEILLEVVLELLPILLLPGEDGDPFNIVCTATGG